MSQLLENLTEALRRKEIRVVDLSQPLGPETPVIQLPPEFAPSEPVRIQEISRYDDRGPAWYWNNLSLGEHSGTHFDAPVHWISGRHLDRNTCDTIPAERFVGPASVLDVTSQVEEDEDFLLEPQHLRRWEAENGQIQPGSWFLVRSGWSRRQGDEFQNIREDGPHSPGISLEASQLLVERDVLGYGVETIGTDAGQAGLLEPPYPNHHTMHAAGKFGLTSLTNLDQLPAIGSIVVAAPLKIVEGSGSPVRVLALVSGP